MLAGLPEGQSTTPTRPTRMSQALSGTVRKTPLNARHRSLGARMVEYGGWDMPVEYSGIVDEHQAVRTRAGLFDVSHMGEIEIAGRDALKAVQSPASHEHHLDAAAACLRYRLAYGWIQAVVACNGAVVVQRQNRELQGVQPCRVMRRAAVRLPAAEALGAQVPWMRASIARLAPNRRGPATSLVCPARSDRSVARVVPGLEPSCRRARR